MFNEKKPHLFFLHQHRFEYSAENNPLDKEERETPILYRNHHLDLGLVSEIQPLGLMNVNKAQWGEISPQNGRLFSNHQKEKRNRLKKKASRRQDMQARFELIHAVFKTGSYWFSFNSFLSPPAF